MPSQGPAGLCCDDLARVLPARPQQQLVSGFWQGHQPFGYGRGGGLPSHPALWGGGGLNHEMGGAKWLTWCLRGRGFAIRWEGPGGDFAWAWGLAMRQGGCNEEVVLSVEQSLEGGCNGDVVLLVGQSPEPGNAMWS